LLAVSERSRSQHFLGAAVLLLAVALSACGGSSADSAEAAPSATAASDDDAFTDCMRENGIELPEGRQFQAGVGATPGPAPDGTMLTEPPRDMTGPAASIDGDAFEAAREACADLLPEGAVMFGGPGGPGGAGVDASAFRAYTSCMADHGVELPEAGPAGADGAAPPAISVDRDDPEFAEAQETCAALLPEVTESAPPTTAA
jgi:hypothetical protein